MKIEIWFFIKIHVKGNSQFIFLCNPQKSLVNVCLLKKALSQKSSCVLLVT